MDKRADRVRPDKTKQPSYQKYYGQGIEHVFASPSTSEQNRYRRDYLDDALVTASKDAAEMT